MSKDWVQDLADMHAKFEFHETVDKFDEELMWKLMKFRFDFLKEELTEGYDAIDERDPEEVVDALIDLCVVAIGTLDLMGVDSHKAWDEVQRANMSKIRGMKATRQNDFGMPDLIKPSTWVGPSHKGNHGKFSK